jgi:lipopolysaccharide heptosyltransferase II
MLDRKKGQGSRVKGQGIQKQYRKVLIFNPFGIGDVLFTTPLIRNLKNNLADVSISYLSNRRAYPLLKENKFLDKVIVFEKDEWRACARNSKWTFLKKFLSFLRDIRKEKFDLVFDLSFNSQYGFFMKIAGIRKRIGYNFKKRGRFLTGKIDIPFGYKDKHVARYYLDLLKFLDIVPQDYKFDLFLSEEKKQKAEEQLEKYGIRKNDVLVAVCPGAGDSWQETAYFKRWPKDYFLKLCKMMQEQLGAKVVLFGSKAENQLAEYIYNGVISAKTTWCHSRESGNPELEENHKPVNLCGKLSLEEFVGILSLCELVVANDGGAFHLAQALGKKIVVFFGPVDDKVYGCYPESSNCIVLGKVMECRPCYYKLKFQGCDYDKKCLRDISVEEAFAAVKQVLSCI